MTKENYWYWIANEWRCRAHDPMRDKSFICRILPKNRRPRTGPSRDEVMEHDAKLKEELENK